MTDAEVRALEGSVQFIAVCLDTPCASPGTALSQCWLDKLIYLSPPYTIPIDNSIA